MHLLITGGTGFIGSRLAITAKDLGHDVRVSGLTNTSAETANAAELAGRGIEVLIRPLDELVAEPGVFRGCDAIVHLAAAQHEVNVSDDHYRRVNVEGTRALLTAAAAAGARLVYGGTIGVYGAREGTISETTAVAPDNIYGRTKLEAERVVLAEATRQPVTVIRISETYGPGDRRLLKLFRAIRKGSFARIGSGRNLHHPVYVDDLVVGLLRAAEHPAALGEVFILPGRDAVSTDEMIDAVAAAVGRPVRSMRVPIWPLSIAAKVLETTLRPLGIQPPLHRRRMDFFTKSFSFNCTKARDLLSYVPSIGFAEGAARTAAWYRSIGEL